MDSKSKFLIFGGAGVLIIGLLLFFLLRGGDDSGNQETEDGAASTQSESSAPGKYIIWSDEQDFATYSDQQRWLFFHASWCNQCKALEKDVKENSGDIPEDVVIFQVDYDSNQALRQQYGVTIQTTIVSVNSEGEKTDIYIAHDNELTLAQLIEELYEPPADNEESQENQASRQENNQPADDDEKKDENNTQSQSTEEGNGGDAPSVGGNLAEEQPVANEPETPVFSNRYINWTGEQNFMQYSAQKRWLFFHADWCNQCEDLEEDIKSNLSDIPEDVIIFQVDYDSNQALRQKYDITIQTTIVSVNSEGEKTDTYIAHDKVRTLAKLIEELN